MVVLPWSRRSLLLLLWTCMVILVALPLAIYGVPTEILRVSPTPANFTNLSVDYFVANFTFDGPATDTCLLDYYNTSEANYTMTFVNYTQVYYGGQCSFNVSGQPDGDWNFSVYVNDTDNNWSWNGTWFLTIDTTLPDARIYVPANTTYNTTSLQLNFSYNESNPDSCWFDHNGTNTTIPACGNYTFTAADNQVSTLKFYMNDTAGNLNSTSVTFTVNRTCYCSTCGECNTSLSNSSCSLIYLTADIINQTGDCIINSTGFTGKTFDCQNHTIDGNDTLYSVGIQASRATENKIQNCIVSDFWIGIYVANSTNHNLLNNTVYSNTYGGLELAYSNTSNLTDNNASYNNFGIIFVVSNTTSLANNTAVYNDYHGFVLSLSNNNTLTDNTAIGNNYYGIYTEFADYNNLSRNTVSSNNMSGVKINFYSDNNRLENNTVNSNNESGICFSFSSNNTLINNTVSNNQMSGLNISDSLSTVNIVNSNTFCSNNQSGGSYYDVYDAYVASSNAGDNNTCNTTYNWNDTGNGLGGCTYGCGVGDIRSPFIVLNNPSDSGNVRNQTTFNCSAYENTYIVNATLYGNWSGGWHANETNATVLDNANYTFTKNLSVSTYIWNCYVCDINNNCAFASSNNTFSVDVTPPNITINTPTNSTTNSNAFNFSFGENVSWIGYSVDGEANTTNISVAEWTGSISSLSDGHHNITVYANDSAGNMNSVTVWFTYDSTTPSAVLYTPTNTTYSSGTGLQLNYSSSDTHLNATYYSLDNWTNITLSGNTTFNVSDEGFHYVRLHANDSAGNVNSTRKDFTVDLSAPAVTSISPAAGATWSSSSTVTFTYNVSDLSIANCTLVINPATDENTSSVVVNTTQSFTKTLSNGDYTWYLRCYDNANHVNTSAVRTLTVSYSSGTSGTTGSGDSGSGGGGETTAARHVKATKSWDTISPTTPAEMSISNDEIPLTNIKIEASETMQSVSLTVEALSSKPSEVSAPTGQVYKYLKLDAPDVNESRTKSITIKFQVSTSWISSNTIDEESVTLNRHSAGSWVKLSTNHTGSSSTHQLYEATTPGFSYFSISGDKKASICTAGEKRCYNDTYLQMCSGDGTEWVDMECEYGCDNESQACFAALMGACTNGERKCQGKGLWVCENSSWNFETMCKYGCSGNACAVGTTQLLWYGLIIGAIAACAVLIIILIWHEKVHHPVKRGVSARNPIRLVRTGTFSLYNPNFPKGFKKPGFAVVRIQNPFVMPIKPKKLKMKKPKKRLWLRGRLRKWG